MPASAQRQGRTVRAGVSGVNRGRSRACADIPVRSHDCRLRCSATHCALSPIRLLQEKFNTQRVGSPKKPGVNI